MLRWLCGLLAILALAGCDWSDEPPPGQPALWQISSEDGTEGYLFGTIHALPDGVNWRTQLLEESLSDSDILVVEIENFDVQSLAAALSRTPNSGLITERVAPHLRVPALQILGKSGIPESRFVDVEDWAVALTLAAMTIDADPMNGVDRRLILDARDPLKPDMHKPILELEGARHQLEIFDRLPAKAQRDMLNLTIENYADGQNQSAQLRQYWLTGDIDEIEEQVEEDLSDYPALYNPLMIERNVAMGAKVAAMLEKADKPFVAVGAAHMVGETGLPALLEKRGYKVTRIQ